MRDGSIFLDLIIMFLSISGYEGQEYNTTKREIIPDGEISPLGSNSSRLAHPKDMVPGKSKRIIGGDVTRPNEYPYQVALFVTEPDGNEKLCGGTILSTQWILSAANCFEYGVQVDVYLGAHNIDIYKNTSIQTIINVKRKDWIIHEKYVKDIYAYDIALIRLPKKITLGRYINSIEIDQGKETHSGEWGRCIGWGYTVSGNTSTLLRCVDLQIISNDECRKNKAFQFSLSDFHHICTSGQGPVGTCNGDSGGPLIVRGIQVGIVSYGPVDCNKGVPSAYTRVNTFSGWILDKTGLPMKEKRSASRVLSPFKALYMGMMLCVVIFNYYL